MSSHKTHAHLPWTAEINGFHQSGRILAGDAVVAHTTNPQDTRYIAQACSLYPAMLEALRFADMALADVGASRRKGYLQRAIPLIREALAAADGGAS